MPLITEAEVLERARRYLATLANIRRMGRALTAYNRGIGQGFDNPYATEAEGDNDVGTQEEYEHSTRLGLNGRPLENPSGTGMDREGTGIESTIQVNKGYKPRKLKMDPTHIVQRRVQKKIRKKPQWKQHHKKVVKKYMQRFGKQIKKRQQKVHQIRQQRHLD